MYFETATVKFDDVELDVESLKVSPDGDLQYVKGLRKVLGVSGEPVGYTIELTVALGDTDPGELRKKARERAKGTVTIDTGSATLIYDPAYVAPASLEWGKGEPGKVSFKMLALGEKEQ